MRHFSRGLQAPILALLAIAGCGQAPGTAPGLPATAPSASAALPGERATQSDATGTDAATPAPPASATAAPVVPLVGSPAPGSLALNFESLAAGAFPADFINVASDETVPDWVYPGKWTGVVDETGNHVFEFNDLQQQPAISLVRFRGSELGTPNGVLPDRYFAQVDMRPLASPYNYPPTGDQGVQFFYLSFDHYVELVIKPDTFEVWECNGGVPKTDKGWTRIYYKALSTGAGQVRQIGALVDKKAGTFTAYLSGKLMGTAKSSLIVPGPSYLTLRGIGNQVSFDNLLIQPR